MERQFWDEIGKMHSEMDRLFNDFYGYPQRKNVGYTKQTLPTSRRPICSMCWEKNNLVTQFELPGVLKEGIQLNIGEGFLEVKVDKKKELENENSRMHSISSQSFFRQVPLPENADTEKAEADFMNGLLKITMPKIEKIESKTKKLEIN